MAEGFFFSKWIENLFVTWYSSQISHTSNICDDLYNNVLFK